MRYAVETIVLVHERNFTVAKATAKMMGWIGLIGTTISIAISGALFLFGLGAGWNVWANIASGALTAYLIADYGVRVSVWLVKTPKRRAILAKFNTALSGYKAIAIELSEQSFDPETILQRLQKLEVMMEGSNPSYVYTLLKRLTPTQQSAARVAA